MRRLCADVRESRRQNAATALMRLSDEFPLSQSSVHLCDNNDDERRRSAVQPHIISMPSKHPRSGCCYVAIVFSGCRRANDYNAMGWGRRGCYAFSRLYCDSIVVIVTGAEYARMLITSLNHAEGTSGFNKFTYIERKLCIEFLNNNKVTVRYYFTVANHFNMESKSKGFRNILLVYNRKCL